MSKPWNKNWETASVEIGGGGQGKVRIVSDRHTGRKGALKILKSPKDIERRARMYREVAALISLEGLNINIPSVFEHNLDQWKDTSIPLFIVMDYIQGPTLETYIKENGPMSLVEAHKLMSALINIVSKCHEKGIVHRDIKPDNIILYRANIDSPFIIDFGLTFNRDSDQGLNTDTDQQMGNRFLLLPELTTPSKHPDAKRQIVSDITQLVGIFFFVLTNERPVTLQDEKGKKPHERRDFAYKELSAGQGLDVLFSTGFTYESNKRIQSGDALMEWLNRTINPQPFQNSSTILALQKFMEKNLEPSINKERWQRETCDKLLKTVIEEFSIFVNTATSGVFVASQSGRYDGGFEEVPGKFHYGVNIHEPNHHTIYYRIHWIGDYDEDMFYLSTKEPLGRETIGAQPIGNEILLVEDAKIRFDSYLSRSIQELT